MRLFRNLVPENRQHPNYRAIADAKAFEAEIALIQSWAEGFVDRDGKFVKEFQTTFNSCFWELYLFACAKHLGFQADFSHETPDFILTGHGSSLVAEATIASHPEGATPEWERDLQPEILAKLNPEEILWLASIRLGNAITSKVARYRQSYSSMPHVAGKPFVICVAPFEQPFFFVQNDNALRRVLYAFNQPLFTTDERTGQKTIVGEARAPEVLKHTGTAVRLGFFTRPDMPEVSAVIFSNTATLTKVRALCPPGSYPVMMFGVRYNEYGPMPHQIAQLRGDYRETLLDGLHVCLNPFATHPLDITPYVDREIALHTYDPASEQYLTRVPDGFLIQHSCFSAMPTGTMRRVRDRIKRQLQFKPMKPKPWLEGELVDVNSQVAMFDSNHMAHYRGWTIVVARDTIDEDWGAQATKGTYGTLQEFITANGKPDAQYAFGQEFYVTKEAALESIKAEIDAKEDRLQT